MSNPLMLAAEPGSVGELINSRYLLGVRAVTSS
jgi:hypothetical protein